jgi:hypothetical protein
MMMPGSSVAVSTKAGVAISSGNGKGIERVDTFWLRSLSGLRATACPQFGVELMLDLDDPVRVGATRGRLGQCVGQLAPHVLPRCYPPVSAQAVELDRQLLPRGRSDRPGRTVGVCALGHQE